MHCGFLDLEGAKMSKSLGNVVRLRDALAKVDAEALRFFFLSTHYRHPLNFGEKALQDAEGRMEYFYETLRKVDERVAGKDFGKGPLHGDPRALPHGVRVRHGRRLQHRERAGCAVRASSAS